MSDPDRGSWWSDNRKWALPVGCVTLAVIVVCGFVYGLFAVMKSADAYKGAVTRARNHPKVTAGLGAPVREGWYLTGNISVSGPSGHANLSIPLSGPKGQGTLFVVAYKSAGRWSFSTLVFQDSSGQRTDLLASQQQLQEE